MRGIPQEKDLQERAARFED
uniref:Uncharacterized protein n=1 Tax=Timema poppense TaxID=170557 RepID=A0A7R9DUC4_TIMPO|nr:unnamed protein product [Timema poppensis]